MASAVTRRANALLSAELEAALDRETLNLIVRARGVSPTTSTACVINPAPMQWHAGRQWRVFLAQKQPS